MNLYVTPDGSVHGLYREEIQLAALGTVRIRRASHVEPNREGYWWANLLPMGRPRLGTFE